MLRSEKCLQGLQLARRHELSPVRARRNSGAQEANRGGNSVTVARPRRQVLQDLLKQARKHVRSRLALERSDECAADRLSVGLLVQQQVRLCNALEEEHGGRSDLWAEVCHAALLEALHLVLHEFVHTLDEDDRRVVLCRCLALR